MKNEDKVNVNRLGEREDVGAGVGVIVVKEGVGGVEGMGGLSKKDENKKESRFRQKERRGRVEKNSSCAVGRERGRD